MKLIAFWNKSIVKKLLKIKKRARFVIAVLVVSFFMLISTFYFFDKAIFFLVFLLISSYILIYFALLEGIEKIEWIMLFIPQILLTVSFYLAYFLFPGRWLTRLPLVIIYAISFYALLLSSNIFNVGVEKNLQLYRAAFSVNYFYQTIISFFLFQTILSFHLNFLINGLLIAGIGYILAFHLFWTQKLNRYIEKKILHLSFLIFLILFEMTIIFSFIPLNTSIFSLILTAIYYSFSGMIYNHLDETLFEHTIKEYLMVIIVVSIIALLSISWGGV